MEPGARRRRPTGVRRLWAGVTVGGLALVAFPPSADAQERQGTTIEVDAGYGGTYIVGRRLPVHVTVRTDRLVQGTLEVTVPGQPGTWGIDVEVPGGGVSDFVVVVPTPNFAALRDVDVRLVGAGEPVTGEGELDPLTDEQLVGLLPEAMPADLPQPLTLTAEAGTARFVELDLDEIAVAGVLDPIGTVVGGAGELGRLSADARSSVLDWVDRGGRLVVDGAPGTPVAGLPDEWQPRGDRTAAGLGEVRAVGGAVAAGRWADVVEPTPTATHADIMSFGGVSVAQLEAVGDAVARDAGLSALELPWLLGFLAVYVVIVGPVAFLVLRRRRAALGWLVVPVVAGLFTAGSFVVGSDLRSGTTAAHGTVLETGPAGARATTVLGLVSRNGRDGRGSFPPGWTAGAVDNSFFGGQLPGTTELAVRSTGAGVRATVPLAAGGFGVLRGAGPVEATEGLVVDARTEGDEVVVTIRNELPFALDDVGAMLGRDAERVGRIGPGETAEARFEGRELDQRDAYMPPEAALWPAESGYGSAPRFDSIVNLALWNEAHLALGPNARTRGVVNVVGWTRSMDSPADVPGEDDPEGRSAVVARATVVSGDGSVSPGSVHRELVRGPGAIDLPDDDVQARVAGSLWRFVLPDGATASAFAIDAPAYIGRVDVWDGAAWRTLDDSLDDVAGFNGDIARVREVSLPAELVAGGQVWVRGWLLTDFGGFDGAGLEVRQA
jgi:hypothetical protein